MVVINISKNIMRIMCIVLVVLMFVTSIVCGRFIRNLEETVEIKEKQTSEIEEKNEKLTKEKGKLTIDLEDKNNKIDKLEKEIEKLSVENEKLKDEIERVEKENEELKRSGVGMSIPTEVDSSIKTYMDYRCIRIDSKQGRIVYGVKAWTDEDGLRRWEEYYCVALGSYYGNVGDKFVVETDNGNKYKIIKADAKANQHTDSSNRYTVATGCMMEWVVETNKLDNFVKKSGNINNVDKVSGKIVKITKIKG